MDPCRESADLGEGDRDLDINFLDSVNLWQYSTVPSKCLRFPWTLTWSLLCFNCWSHFKKRPGRVYSVTWYWLLQQEGACLLHFNVLHSLLLRWFINFDLIYMNAICTWIGSFVAIVHWSTTNMLFLLSLILNHLGIFYFSQISDLFLRDIFEHNLLLQTNTSTTFQCLIIHNVVPPLKDVAISGVSWLWWGRSRLRYKSPGFR